MATGVPQSCVDSECTRPRAQQHSPANSPSKIARPQPVAGVAAPGDGRTPPAEPLFHGSFDILRRVRSHAGMKPTFSLLLVSALLRAGIFSAAAQEKDSAVPFKNDPAARALYDQMVDTMRKANSLSWVGDYRWEANGRSLGHATYKVWLKKPNFARVEAMPAGKSDPSGILVGDGDYFWIYWPNGKPRYGWEMKGKYAEEFEKYQNSFYKKIRTPVGRHSIAHEVGSLGAGMAMTILDASTFHGYTDSLQRYIDAARLTGTEKVDGEDCDVLEISIMKHQRSWHLWLAKKDHLPRKLKQIIRVSHDITTDESWTQVTVNPEIPDSQFVWKLPDGWHEWKTPDIEEGLLKTGAVAPDFELTSTDNKKIKLSNFRGQIVWLNKWRCG